MFLGHLSRANEGEDQKWKLGHDDLRTDAVGVRRVAVVGYAMRYVPLPSVDIINFGKLKVETGDEGRSLRTGYREDGKSGTNDTRVIQNQETWTQQRRGRAVATEFWNRYT
jgi:hypothetical protein